jgi:hypothetical protein
MKYISPIFLEALVCRIGGEREGKKKKKERWALEDGRE